MKKRIRSQAIMLFTRQLATLLSAGLPLMQALTFIEKQTQTSHLKTLILELRTQLTNGVNFSNALKKHPDHFDVFYCHLIEAGEHAGKLDSMLDRLAQYLEKTHTLKQKMRRALFYPALILSVALGVSGILLISVVPQFKGLFAELGADLPPFTAWVLRLSEGLRHHGHFIVIMLGSLVFFLSRHKMVLQPLKPFWDRWILKMPVVGTLFLKAMVARFARTLSTTFSAGVPLIEALQSVAHANRNQIICQAILKVSQDIGLGIQMHTAMERRTLFPPLVIQMVAIGEASGTLDTMLEKVATLYEEAVEITVEGLGRLVEPLIIVTLGILIGGLVIALYLPIFQLGSVI